MHICGWTFLDFSSHLSTKAKGMGDMREHPVHYHKSEPGNVGYFLKAGLHHLIITMSLCSQL